MKPPSQVGIPSGLPRPRGPDVLQALGAAGAEVPDSRRCQGPRSTCLLLPPPKPLPQCLYHQSQLWGKAQEGLFLSPGGRLQNL